jgi:ubiquinone/menaquinone biosynthesis C-methylase UbiE
MSYIPTGKELIDPFKVLEEAGLGADMKVADFGCGTLGHYVFSASRVVGPAGKVYAVDILKSVLDGIESMVRIERVTNVETVWGDLERVGGIKLPDGSLDVGLMINNLYLTNKQNEMTKECVRMVRSGGTFVIVDWKPQGATFGPDPKARVSAEAAMKLGLDAGLMLVKEFVPGPYHYGFIFKKP